MFDISGTGKLLFKSVACKNTVELGRSFGSPIRVITIIPQLVSAQNTTSVQSCQLSARRALYFPFSILNLDFTPGAALHGLQDTKAN